MNIKIPLKGGRIDNFLNINSYTNQQEVYKVKLDKSILNLVKPLHLAMQAYEYKIKNRQNAHKKNAKLHRMKRLIKEKKCIII